VFSLTTLLIVASITFIVGCLLSVLLTRSLSSSEQKTRNLETRLQEAEDNLSSYQQDVTEHFAETAQLVNNLTQNYKDVHEHLAGSALKLANVDISRQLLSTNPSDGEAELNLSEEAFQPPKDWAPSEGTLSESYGLTDTETTPDADPIVAQAQQAKAQ
jgi:uncharacterized membrane-anchored protein YhcB (DUF1043 family)